MKCSKCGKRKREKAFATFRTRTGELRRRGECWECRGKYATENFERLQKWRKEYNAATKTTRQLAALERRRVAKEFVDAFKNTPCADCGVKYPPVAMDLDHVRGGKIRNISSLVSAAYKIELIKEELKKCEVVCAICHRIRTRDRKENLAPSITELRRKPTGASRRRS
jgi:hypothetical protein